MRTSRPHHTPRCRVSPFGYAQQIYVRAWSAACQGKDLGVPEIHGFSVMAFLFCFSRWNGHASIRLFSLGLMTLVMNEGGAGESPGNMYRCQNASPL